MSGNTRRDFGPPVELAHERDFFLGAITVRPSASEIVVDGTARRIEPRIMQTLVALARADGAVTSRDELMARCWSGMVVGEDAITRAVGKVRRLAELTPRSFTVETIPKVGYRLIPCPDGAAFAGAAVPSTRALAKTQSSLARSIAAAAVLGLVLIAGAFAIGLYYEPRLPTRSAAEQAERLGTDEALAHDRQLRASAQLSAGGRDNALRAEQLLREALELDPSFHAARETLIVALLSVAAFVPERSGAAHAEIAGLLDDEVVETPIAWRAHAMRGFQHVFAGDWLDAERALAKARQSVSPSAPMPGAVGALEIMLRGSVGRISESFDVVARQAQAHPISRDQSRVLQQWLDRTGRHDEAEAEYVRSRDLPGDRSAMELAALVHALGTRNPERIAMHLNRYRETDWGRSGDDALAEVQRDRHAALSLLRQQIEGWREDGAMPPFLAAAWASYYGDHDLAIAGLRAHPDSLFSTAGLMWDRVFAETRRTAAFKELLRDFGYVEYWRAQDAWGDFCRPIGSDDFECR